MLDALLSADTLTWLGGLALLGLVAPMALGPFLVKGALRPLAAIEVEPGAGELPAEVEAHFRRAAASFGRAGFEAVGRFRVRTELGGSQALVVLFRGPNGASIGYAAAIPRPSDHLLYLEIGTSFEDGTSVTVGNASMLGPYVPLPGSVTLQAPWLDEANDLWRIHRALVARRKAGLRARRFLRGEEMRAFREATAASAAHQAACGLLARAPGEAHYTLTWRGACRFTWLSMPPLAPLRLKWVRRRAAALVAELA